MNIEKSLNILELWQSLAIQSFQLPKFRWTAGSDLMFFLFGIFLEKTHRITGNISRITVLNSSQEYRYGNPPGQGLLLCQEVEGKAPTPRALADYDYKKAQLHQLFFISWGY